MALNMFSNFFKDKTIGVDPAQDQKPSIYASPEEWAAFRAVEELTRASMLEGSLPAADAETQRIYAMLTDPTNQGGGAGRGGQGGASFQEKPAQPPIEAPTPTPAPEADILDTLAAGFKVTGGKDKYGVNAVEGANRVNKNTDQFGVKALQGADGKITLTNIGVPSGSYSKPVSSMGSMPTVSNDLHASINTLKGTTDPDVARGLLSNIRETAAQQMASIQGEAMKFAANKLGVPFLETQLREAELADRATEGWYPGIGDSPGTAKIRQTLLVTRSSVDNEAKNYLAGNTTFASMGVALRNAEEEAKRIERLGDRRAALEDNLALRSEIKKQEAISKAEAFSAGATPEMKNRIIALNPSIAAAKDEGTRALALAESIERADSNPAMKAAIGATEQDLPILAMEDNPFATALVIDKEVTRAGGVKTKDQVEAELMKVARGVDSANFAKAAVSKKFGPDKANSDEAKAMLNDLSFSGVGLDKEGKQLQRSRKYALALEMYRAEATDRFVKDISQWPVPDPDFHKAVKTAREVTKSTDVMSVLSEYLKIAPSEGLLGRVQMIQSIAEKEAAKHTGSLFGAPDSVILKGQIAKGLQEMGVWQKIGRDHAEGLKGGAFAIGLLVPDFSKESDLIDPVTGLVRQ